MGILYYVLYYNNLKESVRIIVFYNMQKLIFFYFSFSSSTDFSSLDSSSFFNSKGNIPKKQPRVTPSVLPYDIICIMKINTTLITMKYVNTKTKV